MNFESFELSGGIQKAIKDLGFDKPTDIQKDAIPHLLESNYDFVGQAQTGTGKTGAFLLPLIERLDEDNRGVQALILTPTRELAHQVLTELEKFTKYVGIKALTVYGGVPYARQTTALNRKQVQVVVGTPGRIIDLINKNVLKLGDCEQLVVDEADEMLNMGFLEDVQMIMKSLSKNRRMWMFSATMPRPISQLVEREFNKPHFVKVQNKTLSNENIEQFYCVLDRRNFSRGLKVVLDSEDNYSAIIFCETKVETKNLAESLLEQGVSATALHGDLGQSQRDFAMKKFKDKKVNVLVCTDVAARGIDVSHVTHVFNMGFPRQAESYVHRIGRTGRAGEKGKAISFITSRESRQVRTIENLTKQKMEAYKLPKPIELKKRKVEGEISKLESLKTAVVERGDGFKLDESFEDFKSFLDELSKEQIVKIMFSSRFSKELRQIDESLDLKSGALASGGNGIRSSRSSSRSRPRFGRGRDDRRGGSGQGGNSRRRDGRSEGRSDRSARPLRNSASAGSSDRRRSRASGNSIRSSSPRSARS